MTTRSDVPRSYGWLGGTAFALACAVLAAAVIIPLAAR